MRLRTAWLIAIILLNSCALEVRKYGKIDSADRSITLPAGGDAFLLSLKDYFHQKGWKVENFRGAEITEKRGDTKLKYDSFNTRYILFGEYELDEHTLYGARLERASISLIDIKSRGEVLVFKSRRKTVSSFIQEMGDQIEQNYQP